MGSNGSSSVGLCLPQPQQPSPTGPITQPPSNDVKMFVKSAWSCPPCSHACRAPKTGRHSSIVVWRRVKRMTLVSQKGCLPCNQGLAEHAIASTMPLLMRSPSSLRAIGRLDCLTVRDLLLTPSQQRHRSCLSPRHASRLHRHPLPSSGPALDPLVVLPWSNGACRVAAARAVRVRLCPGGTAILPCARSLHS